MRTVDCIPCHEGTGMCEAFLKLNESSSFAVWKLIGSERLDSRSGQPQSCWYCNVPILLLLSRYTLAGTNTYPHNTNVIS